VNERCLVQRGTGFSSEQIGGVGLTSLGAHEKKGGEAA